MTAASTEEYSANILYVCGQGYRFRMKTSVTESKLTASGMVCSNNDRDGVRLHGYTPLSTQHPTHPGTVQNGTNSKLFKTNCVSSRKIYFDCILYNEFGKIELLKLLIAADI